MNRRRGVTLIELLVVIALLGVMAGISAVSFRAPAVAPVPSLAARVDNARREASRTGREVRFTVDDSVTTRDVRVLPDGRVFADATLGLDMITGRAADATR